MVCCDREGSGGSRWQEACGKTLVALMERMPGSEASMKASEGSMRWSQAAGGSPGIVRACSLSQEQGG